MSEEFKNRVQEYKRVRRVREQMESKENDLLVEMNFVDVRQREMHFVDVRRREIQRQQNARRFLIKIDPTGVLGVVSKNPGMTEEELRVMEIFSREDMHEIYEKYEVYRLPRVF